MSSPSTKNIKGANKAAELKDFKVTIYLRSGSQLSFTAGPNEGLNTFLLEYEEFIRTNIPPEKQKTYYFAMRTGDKQKGHMLYLRLGDIEAVHAESQ